MNIYENDSVRILHRHSRDFTVQHRYDQLVGSHGEFFPAEGVTFLPIRCPCHKIPIGSSWYPKADAGFQKLSHALGSYRSHVFSPVRGVQPCIGLELLFVWLKVKGSTLSLRRRTNPLFGSQFTAEVDES